MELQAKILRNTAKKQENSGHILNMDLLSESCRTSSKDNLNCCGCQARQIEYHDSAYLPLLLNPLLSPHQQPARPKEAQAECPVLASAKAKR